MGLETATIVMAAIAGGAEIGKMGSEYAAAQEQEKALDMQGKEQTIEYQQKSLNNLDAVDKVLQAQEAMESTRGVAFSSPSFNAIQRATLNIGAKNQRNLDTEKSLMDENIDIEKQNVKTSLFASLFGDVANTAVSAYSLDQKLPQLED